MEEKRLKSSVETTTLNVVPDEMRKSWINIAFIQAGVYICVPCLLLGSMLVSAMPLREAIISGVIGYLLSGLIMSFIGVMGSDLGRPTAVVAKSCFGQGGARIVTALIFAVSSFGWFAVQNVVCGEAFSNLLKGSFGLDFPVKISIVLWGIVMLTTAVKGIDGLKWLNKISVPILFLVFLVGMVMAINKYGMGDVDTPPDGEPMSIAEGAILTLSFLACGMTIAPDMTRYQKSRGGVFASSFIGLCPAGIALLIMGAVLTKLTGEYDISIILMQAGIPSLGLIALILATWTTNTTNAYSGGIALVMFFNLKDDKRAIATLIAGIVGTVLALLGFDEQMDAFTNLLGVFFFPVASVMLSDYYFIRKGRPENWKYTKALNIPGFVSWVLGIIATYFLPMGLFLGFVLSGVLYFVLYKVLPRPEEVTDYNGETLIS